MKSSVIFYSYSGNTKRVVSILIGHLVRKGEVEVIALKGLDESHNFFGQAIRAFRHKRAKLEPVNFDLSKYDLVCFGTPVWAFGPAPAMNTYLDNCVGLEGKEVILFATYGSGAGKEKCLNYMQDILAKKGAKSFKRFSIQQGMIGDKVFILSKLQEASV